jgi:hypothetical protein
MLRVLEIVMRFVEMRMLLLLLQRGETLSYLRLGAA